MKIWRSGREASPLGRVARSIPGAAFLIAALAFGLSTALGGAHGALAAAAQSESEAFLQDARQKLAQGQLSAAVIQLKNALQRDASNAEARQLLGVTYVRLGDGASAEKELTRALDLGIEESDVMLELGRAYLLQAKFEQVLKALPLPEPGDPRYPEVLLLHGDARLGLNDPAGASELYSLASTARPEDPRPHLGLARSSIAQARANDAEAHVDSALALSPDSWQALILKGELRRAAGDFGAARTSFAAAVELAPNNMLARLGLASSEIALGQDDQALESLSIVEQHHPNHPIATYLRSLIYLRTKDAKAALDSLERVGAAIEQYAPALLLRGAIRYEQGQLDSAIADLRVVLARLGDHLPTQKLLAAAYLKQGTPDPAIDLLVRASASAGGDPQLHALLGTAYLQKGDAAAGVDQLERAIAENPGQPLLLRQLAIGSLAAGDTSRAILALRSSLDLGADKVSTGLLLGLAELHGGNPEGALEAARSLQAAEPESPIGWNLAGGALMAQGRMKEAREAFLAALAADESFLPARMNLAQAALLDGDLERAENEFREILGRDDRNARAYLGLARIALARGSRQDALAALEQARKAQTESAPEGLLDTASLYEAAGAGDEALRTLEMARRKAPRSQRVLLALARTQQARSDHRRAVSTYQELVALLPQEANLHSELGRAQLLADRPDEARQALRRALEIDPDLSPAYAILARVELRQAGLDAALAVAEQLRARNPLASAADVLTGDLFLLSGRSQAALQAYEAGWIKEKIRELATGRFHSHWQLGDKVAATAALRAWLAESPTDDAIRMQLAGALLEMGERRAAIAEYESLRESQPNNAILLNNLAYLYLELSDARALELARRAHLLAPQSPEIMDTLGWILVNSDAVEEALKILQRAAELRPDQLDIGYHLAVALHESGRSDEARSRLSSLIEDDRAFPSRADAEALLRELSSLQ